MEIDVQVAGGWEIRGKVEAWCASLRSPMLRPHGVSKDLSEPAEEVKSLCERHHTAPAIPINDRTASGRRDSVQ